MDKGLDKLIVPFIESKIGKTVCLLVARPRDKPKQDLNSVFIHFGDLFVDLLKKIRVGDHRAFTVLVAIGFSLEDPLSQTSDHIGGIGFDDHLI